MHYHNPKWKQNIFSVNTTNQYVSFTLRTFSPQCPSQRFRLNRVSVSTGIFLYKKISRLTHMPVWFFSFSIWHSVRFPVPVRLAGVSHHPCLRKSIFCVSCLRSHKAWRYGTRHGVICSYCCSHQRKPNQVIGCQTVTSVAHRRCVQLCFWQWLLKMKLGACWYDPEIEFHSVQWKTKDSPR